MSYVDKWRPFGLLVAVLLSGFLLGIVVSLFSCSSSGTLTGAKEESYLVLAATLYGQGESLGAMKVYLNSFGPRDPATAMLQIADKYEKSGDRKKQQQARDLRQLGEALKEGREPEGMRTGSLTEAPRQTTPIASPTGPTPLEPQASALAQQPTAIATPAPAADSTPTPISGRGVARPASGGAVMREQPSTKAPWIASLQNGAQVEIIRVVEGEAVDSSEPRWYLVKAGDKTGYVYFKLIAAE